MSVPPLREASRAARLMATFLLIFFGWAIVQSALLLPTVGAQGVLVDFDAFYIAGDLAHQGRAVEVYDPRAMAAIQREMVGHDGFMPWTYPPQFNLASMLFPLVPRGLAYALFTGLTLAFYLGVIARLAGAAFPMVLLALAPPIYVTVTIGQNAFLTGGLMGLFCLLALAGRASSGWALGLLVIKPHLGVGLGVHALAAGRWWVIGRALVVAVLSTLLVTWVFGVEIWIGFVEGVDQAAEALRTDFYPLFRMTSVYAALHTLGVEPRLALWVQTGMALMACGAVAVAVLRGMVLRHSLALACFASALVSPYLYDYDMVITGAGIALIAGDLVARTTWPERLLLLALIWVAGGWGMIHAIASAGLDWEDRAANARATLSFGAFAYLALLVLGWRILHRPAR